MDGSGLAPVKAAPYEDQSPTLLAEQPPTLADDGPAPGKNWDAIYAHLEARMQELRTRRWSWWSYWASLAEFLLPRRYNFLVIANRLSRGQPINDSIIDSTASQAMYVCAAGLWTGLTSPSRPWFKMGIGLPWIELDADGKAWLEDTEERIYTVLGGSNFYTIMAQAFQDVATFGTAPVVIYEDHEDAIRCYLPCAGEYYLSTGSRLSNDVFYREFTLTVANIVEMFKLENCPLVIRKLWEQGGAALEQECIVAHAIEPNSPLAGSEKRNGPKIDVVPGGFTFREVYWLRSQKTERELSRKGFNERPFMVARWSTVSNDAYGRSPGMDALGDTMQLQQETRRKAEFIDKCVRPPMGADPSLRNEPASIVSGKVTYFAADGTKKGFFPLFEMSPALLQPLIEDLKENRGRLERAFFVDVFMAISRMEGVQPRNELELTQRNLERLQVLGPFIELFETEFASPAIKRIMAIMERRRMLKPMPASLRGVPLKIDYISIMKLAQRSSESVAIKDVLQTGGGLSAAAKAAGLPDPLRVINLDKAMRMVADLANAPPEIVFSDDEVAKHDAARQKVQQAQQGMQATMAGVNAAKTLSETQIGGGGTALGALLGRGGGTPLSTAGGGQ